ncbi:hypothetical protein J421_4682 (plasmid) [Gemmatirosa kalamazoonensis]|uniref:Uncharacterized protein n=1 Tax=Gemmatirosa kalamazoonensis TaxID=861299 RepID=W0RP65_9BACT|nr:hypothetical protein [Gemmatirosa kalamazoonensis]AHG92150.1 hypothetical protein J421_4615 [Gemmatirosa kalamazoonensis]AHG92217.1 hypothetical protein J421_4682 [Gemmatirosa kalamazoonensis]
MPNALCPTCHKRPDLCSCRFGRSEGFQQRVPADRADASAPSRPARPLGHASPRRRDEPTAHLTTDQKAEAPESPTP